MPVSSVTDGHGVMPEKIDRKVNGRAFNAKQARYSGIARLQDLRKARGRNHSRQTHNGVKKLTES